MPEHDHYEDDAIVNPETAHEKSDVSVRALLTFIAIFIVFAFVTHIAVWLLFKGFVRIERRRQLGPVTEMARPADVAIPQNQPLLQPFQHTGPDGKPVPPYLSTPVTDLAAMRESEQRALTTYGWVDPQKGIVRIPIDEAMKLTLQRGLPVQSGAKP
jgi:hypothetical protein